MEPPAAYSQNVRPIYRFFYYKDMEKEEIEDLTQETFLRFFKKYGSVPLDDLQATKILYGIARNVWKEWVRSLPRHRTEQLFDEDAGFEVFSETQPEEESHDEWQRDRERLHEAIKGMNPVIRSVLTLRFLEGKSRKEIALELGLKEDHVHTYQKRGVRLLQKTLQQPVPPPSPTK